MNTTYPDHLAHALSTLKWDIEDGRYTTCEIMEDLYQTWAAAGLSQDDRERLYNAIYTVIQERNVRQGIINAVEPGTVIGDF